MANLVCAPVIGGGVIEFMDQEIGAGAMKQVYFTPDQTKVVAFYKDAPTPLMKERLLAITGPYRQALFQGEAGNYWKNVFCWPEALVEWNGRLGIVAPAYPEHFYFAPGERKVTGEDKRVEKEGRWFASAKLRATALEPHALGDWLGHLKVCILLARAVRRLHAAGLAHSDLSYKNVLINPVKGQACVIDLDGLVVPKRFAPDVEGTPDFIAPEVVQTKHLDLASGMRKLPCRETDQHALAVLIYMYLLYRHPLNGKKVFDPDDEQDQKLRTGSGALFVEHPQDASNRIDTANSNPHSLPWDDTNLRPYTLTGPYLSKLFEDAFIIGLHQPMRRPTADRWEQALIKTLDLLVRCTNSDCSQKWFVQAHGRAQQCPFCGAVQEADGMFLEFYSPRKANQFRTDQHRLALWNGQSLYAWHVNARMLPDEHLVASQAQRLAYFIWHAGAFWLVNLDLPDLFDLSNQRAIGKGEYVALREGLRLQLSRADDGRQVVVGKCPD